MTITRTTNTITIKCASAYEADKVQRLLIAAEKRERELEEWREKLRKEEHNGQG